jgi:hypothetical protein
MAKYLVKSDINFGQHKPGEVINLSEAEAAKLGDAVSPEAEAEPEAPPEEGPKFRFKASRNFQFKGEQYKKDQELVLDLAAAQEIGSERIELVDQEAYKAYMESQNPKS